MTRSELRAVLQDFRAMVRERGPRECLEVASVRWVQWVGSETDAEETARFWVWSRSSLAALRWWRWANRDWRFVTVSEPTVHGTALYVRWYSENR